MESLPLLGSYLIEQLSPSWNPDQPDILPPAPVSTPSRKMQPSPHQPKASNAVELAEGTALNWPEQLDKIPADTQYAFIGIRKLQTEVVSGGIH
jgi:hypothetical protein